MWLDENYQEADEAREETFKDWTPRKTEETEGDSTSREVIHVYL